MTAPAHRRTMLKGLAASATLAAAPRALAQQAGASKVAGETIVVTGVSSFGTIKGLLPRFTKETGVKVDLQILPYPQLRTRAMADLVGGTANSDIYLQDIIWLGEWATNGYVLPLDGYFQRDAAAVNVDDILPGAFNALSRWDGKIWSVPVGAFYFLNYYRTDWFAAHHLTPPVTLDDVDRDAAALTNPAKNQYGIAMAYQRGTAIASWFLATYVGAGGNLLTNPPKDFTPTLTSKRAHTVLTHYIDWLKWAPRDAVGYHWNDQTTAMQNGLLGMAPTFSVNGTQFVKPEVSQIAKDVGFTYMPRLEKGDQPVVPFGGWAAAINKHTKKAEAAWQFLRFVIDPRTQLDLAAIGGTPVRYSSLEDAKLQQQFPWFKLILDAEKRKLISANYRPRYPFYPKVEEVLGLQLNRAALHQTSVADALSEANKAITGIVKEAGYPVL